MSRAPRCAAAGWAACCLGWPETASGMPAIRIERATSPASFRFRFMMLTFRTAT
jgi:hypothetical protein